MAIGRRLMGRPAKKRGPEERDRQEQQERQEERNETVGAQSARLFPDRDPLPRGMVTQWGQQSSGLAAACAPAPGNDIPAAGTDPGGAVVTATRICVVVIEIRISGPGSEAGQPVRLTIERREVVIPAERGTPGDPARKAEECLGEEMKGTVAAAAGEKIADRILPAQGPAAAAEVADLQSDLHSIMLGQLVPPLAQYVPLPGVDRSLDTAEVVILVGGIVLSLATANLALYSVCVKSLAHKAIADAAAKAIKAALSDYARPLPPVRVIPEGPDTVKLNSPPPNEPEVSPDGPEDVSPGNHGF